MRLFGLEITRKSMVPVPTRGSSWWGVIREPFTGAWQKNVQCESNENLLAFPTVYTCVSLIAGDIAKLRIRLMQVGANGVPTEVTNSPLGVVLRKPNRYQTRIQFISQWIVQKLMHGNAYVLKEYDERRVVRAMYVLDSKLIMPLVTEEGDVFYQIGRDDLAGITVQDTFPASEIIHDRMLCLWHPLVGVAPLYAAASAATQGVRIQANSAKFFENMSRPGGQLTAPGTIADETAERLKRTFEEKFSGGNLGRFFVAGDGLKYEPIALPADQAQLIEQLEWTGKNVAQPFHVPLYKIGLGTPPTTNVAALNQEYYSQCLQQHVEDIEALLDEALGLADLDYGTEFDLEGLMRMDPLTQADVQEKGARAGTFAPNENRKKWGLPPVDGGDSPMIQQQNFSLAAIAKRDAQDDPFGKAPPETPALPPPEPSAKSADDDERARIFLDRLKAGFPESVDA